MFYPFLVIHFLRMAGFIVSGWFENKFIPSYLFFRDGLAENRYKKEKEKAKAGLVKAREVPEEFEDDSDSVLFITHGRGGEVEQNVEYMAERLESEGIRVFVMHYTPLKKSMILSRAAVLGEDIMNFRFPAKYAELVATLGKLQIKRIYLHHTQFLPYYFLQEVPSFAKLLGVPFDYFVYDFISICPRINLIDGSEKYCGEPQVKTCNSCISKNGSFTPSPKDVGEWRKAYSRLLKSAEKIYAPSHDAAKRISNYFPRINIKIRPHPENPPKITPQKIKRREGEHLRVGIIGNISEYKGSDILLACVKDAVERELPLEFRIIGNTTHDEEIEQYENVTEITGSYDDKLLARHFREQLCHVAFFPSVYPETYSFFLTRAIMGCMFPVAFDMGELAERIKNIGWGKTLSPELIDSPEKINDALLEMDITLRPDEIEEKIFTKYGNIKTDYLEG